MVSDASLPRASSPAGSSRARAGWQGDLSMAAFLGGVLEATRAQLPEEFATLENCQQGALIKVFGDEPAIHFELWLHRGRGRVELALHFETRDPERNTRLLEYMVDELAFLKATLSERLEAEPWDKGWTRVYLTRPLERLDRTEQASLATAFATFISVLDPLRREAMELHARRAAE
jgi:hypothetical protein